MTVAATQAVSYVAGDLNNIQFAAVGVSCRLIDWERCR